MVRKSLHFDCIGAVAAMLFLTLGMMSMWICEETFRPQPSHWRQLRALKATVWLVELPK
jgi:hypothetical protein